MDGADRRRARPWTAVVRIMQERLLGLKFFSAHLYFLIVFNADDVLWIPCLEVPWFSLETVKI